MWPFVSSRACSAADDSILKSGQLLTCAGSPHASFDWEKMPVGSPPRESIEVRVLVLSD